MVTEMYDAALPDLFGQAGCYGSFRPPGEMDAEGGYACGVACGAGCCSSSWWR
jgi:hypothetical protein